MDLLYNIKGLRGLLLLIQNFFFNISYRSIFGKKVKIFGWPIMSFAKGSSVNIGERLTLISSSFFSEPGINHQVIIRLSSKTSVLKIGDDVGISGGGICVKENITIGNRVMLGANAFITDTDFHPISAENRRFNRDNAISKPVLIEDNVFLGMNTIVLKGVTIGENSIVGAGSLVVKDIPKNEIWGGNPAKFIKKL